MCYRQTSLGPYVMHSDSNVYGLNLILSLSEFNADSKNLGQPLWKWAVYEIRGGVNHVTKNHFFKIRK